MTACRTKASDRLACSRAGRLATSLAAALAAKVRGLAPAAFDLDAACAVVATMPTSASAAATNRSLRSTERAPLERRAESSRPAWDETQTLPAGIAADQRIEPDPWQCVQPRREVDVSVLTGGRGSGPSPGCEDVVAMKATTNERIADSLQELGTETAFSVLARAKELERAGRRIVHLEIGEPDFETPAHITEAGIRALRAGE